MLRLYILIGKMVEDEFDKNKWGAKVTEEISARLQQELSGLRGFSSSNIRKMRIFYQEWNKSDSICPTMTDKLKNHKNLVSSSLTSEIETNKNEIGSSLTNQLENNDFSIFVSVSFTHVYKTSEILPPELKNALPDAETLKKLMD